MIDDTIKVDDIHFAYLKVQKGKLDSFAHDREVWHRVYQRDLFTTYSEMKPYLPERCWGILDVGSGLGGIDILLSRHYGNQPYINLLDGEGDPPEMVLHSQTFNSMKVAKHFQVTNGVRADRFAYYTPESTDFVKPYDLALSLGSWCFHYAPDTYLKTLVGGGGLDKDSVLILDVRKDKPAWSRQLNDVLAAQAVIRDSAKYQRTVYGVR